MKDSLFEYQYVPIREMSGGKSILLRIHADRDEDTKGGGFDVAFFHGKFEQSVVKRNEQFINGKV